MHAAMWPMEKNAQKIRALSLFQTNFRLRIIIIIKNGKYGSKQATEMCTSSS